ncbi:GNAT family N-acetyltransferase [Streptomyces sp. AK010]|uniref:GNAT family N-acetyltransferase n=1 Tax=Streptomyces sp. AK010 TaxID=2723074 RepID=UPI00160CDB80|nr:GNAT family N-acetyltransferase [Streptomyces sp. AK010]
MAVHTVADRRRRHLAPACVTAVREDIASRGHTPGWNCSVHNRAGRLLAWTAGFRLVREYVHFAGCWRAWPTWARTRGGWGLARSPSCTTRASPGTA